MKNFKLITSIGLALTLVFASCSVEKRHYTKGYSVNWNSNAPKATEQAQKTSKVAVETGKSVVTVTGVERNAKIESVATPELSASTTTTVASTKKATQPALAKANTNANPTKANNSKVDIKKNTDFAAKIAKKVTGAAAGGKSQLIALLLVIFVGVLGIHRMYLGYIGIGIIQLLTAGGCGVWALIDLIRIITGDLGPKDGSGYSETL
ncbi:MAG: TM2 domain-containing protein [Sphingobacteriales bacterium JAD_PAG50586_3]|nr:MAG: TM2 domain-containing protein [Sphingobacteriales bacterium JAD_PAG50586_3]